MVLFEASKDDGLKALLRLHGYSTSGGCEFGILEKTYGEGDKDK